MAQKVIGKDTFTVNPLLAEAGFLLQPLIVPAMSEFVALYGIFADTMISLMDGGKRETIEPAELLERVAPALERISPVLERLCKKLPPDQLRLIKRQLLEGATMSGQLLYTPQGNPIDVLMQGRTIDMWRLILFAMETSYPDFFDLLRVFRAPAKAPEASAT